MIEGIGVDIVSHRRIKSIFNKYGDRFVKRVLSEKEQKEFSRVKDKVSFLSSRWAAKEALVKALGETFIFSQVSVLKEDGKPFINLDFSGKKVHISLSHEKDYSIAFAVVETPLSGNARG